jgi:hypothetical protein
MNELKDNFFFNTLPDYVDIQTIIRFYSLQFQCFLSGKPDETFEYSGSRN